MGQNRLQLTHKLKYKVDIFIILGPDYVMQLYNIRMISKFLQEHYLTECPLQKKNERKELLNCHICCNAKSDWKYKA